MAKDPNNRIGGHFPDEPEDPQHSGPHGDEAEAGLPADESEQLDAFFDAMEATGPFGDGEALEEDELPAFMEEVGKVFGINPMEMLKHHDGNNVNTPIGIIKLSLDASGNLVLQEANGAPASPELVEAFCRMVEVLKHLPQMKQLFEIVPGLHEFVEGIQNAKLAQEPSAEPSHPPKAKTPKAQQNMQAMRRRPFQPFGLSFEHLQRAVYLN